MTFSCDIEDCSYSGETKSALKKHQKDVHEKNMEQKNIHEIDNQEPAKIDTIDPKDENPKLESVLEKEDDSDKISDEISDEIPDKNVDKPDDPEDLTSDKIKERSSKSEPIVCPDPNIESIPSVCDQIGCCYKYTDKIDKIGKTDTTNQIVKHLAIVHDIGKLECGICSNKCAILTERRYSKTKEKVKMCRNCYELETGYSSKLSKAAAEYIKSTVSQKSTKHWDVVKKEVDMSGRSDLILEFLDLNLVIYIFLDVLGGRYTDNDYRSIENKMRNIQYQNPDRLTVFIRWNVEDLQNLTTGQTKKNVDQIKLLSTTVKNVIQYKKRLWTECLMHIFYINYSDNNKLVVKTIPTYLIQDEYDLINGNNNPNEHTFLTYLMMAIVLIYTMALFDSIRYPFYLYINDI